MLDLPSAAKIKQCFDLENIIHTPELGNLGELPDSRPEGTFVTLLLKLGQNLNIYHHFINLDFPIEGNAGTCAQEQ